jgi:uncharacterized protein YhdP
VFAILAWRLASSPLSLNFFTPIIEQNFSAEDKSYVVRVGDTVLIWDGWRRPADIRARNIKVFNRDGKLLAQLPQVSIGLSMRALLRGRVAVSSLGIRRLSASVERYKDGGLTVGLLAKKGPAQNVDVLITRITNELSRPPSQTGGLLGYLNRVEIIESKLVFNDRKGGVVWRSPRTDLVMIREKSGLRADAAISIAAQNRSSKVFAQLDFKRKPGVFVGRVRFEGLNPSLVSRSIDGLDDLANFSMPVAGELAVKATRSGSIQIVAGTLNTPIGKVEGNFEFASDGDAVSGLVRLEGLNVSEVAKRIPRMRKLAGVDLIFNGNIGGQGQRDGWIKGLEFNLVSGEGTVDVPVLWNGPRSIKEVRIKGEVLDGLDKVEIAEALIDFGGPKIEAEARIQRLGDEARLQLDATLFDMPFKEVSAYWPKALALSARRWIKANINNGYARETNLRLIGWMNSKDFSGLKVSSVNGTMRYDGLTVDYWSPLPKLKHVDGTATFTADRFDMVISSGVLQKIIVDQAQVNMFDLQSNNEQISVDVLMQGPIKTVLNILDHKPLEYIEKLGITADSCSGAAAIRLRMDFPLDTNVERDALRVSSTATLKNVGILRGPFGLNLKGGRLAFKMQHDDMKVTGPLQLNGVPTKIVWHERFGTKGEIRSKYRVQARLTKQQRESLGLKNIGFLSGPVDTDMTYTVLRNKQRLLKADVDLTDAYVSRNDLVFEKKSGEKALAKLSMKFNRKAELKSGVADLSGTELSGAAQINFSPSEREHWRLQLNEVSLKGNRVHGAVTRRSDNVYEGNLDIGRYDITHAMAQKKIETAEKESTGLAITANIGELTWGAKRKLVKTNLTLRHDGKNVQALYLSGNVRAKKPLLIDFQPTPAGYGLKIEADDFGGALKALDMARNVIGGKLKIEGIRKSLFVPMEGTINVSDYRLKKAPAIARILQVTSLTGIVDAIGQRGLELDVLEGKFAFNEGLLRLEETRTYGSSIGITTEGTLDLNKDIAALEGTVVPAYTINRILGKIPVLGQILTGGDNEGMFAATYSVKGPISDPEVTVNPLSALAPGFLRKFFGVFSGKAGDPKAPEISKPDKAAQPAQL